MIERNRDLENVTEEIKDNLRQLKRGKGTESRARGPGKREKTKQEKKLDGLWKEISQKKKILNRLKEQLRSLTASKRGTLSPRKDLGVDREVQNLEKELAFQRKMLVEIESEKRQRFDDPFYQQVFLTSWRK